LPDRIAQAVEKGREMGTAPVDRELWDMPALFLLCLVLLSVEWIVRRKSGLA
jgi:hypothetical protein